MGIHQYEGRKTRGIVTKGLLVLTPNQTLGVSKGARLSLSTPPTSNSVTLTSPLTPTTSPISPQATIMILKIL